MPLAHDYAGAPAAADARAGARAAQALARARRLPQGRPEREVRRRTCSPTTASRSPAACTTRCSSRTCWKSHEPTTRQPRAAPSAAGRRSTYEEVAGKGAGAASRFDQVEIDARHRVRRARTPTSRCALHEAALSADRARTRSSSCVYERDRDAACVPVLLAHGAQRRADRRASCSTAQSHELGKEMLELEQQRLRARPASRSTSARRSRSARSCSSS